jgi:hypothetical protein
VSKVATEAGDFHEGVLLKEQPADYYRTTADRYRKLLTETTTRVATARVCFSAEAGPRHKLAQGIQLFRRFACG